MTINRQYEYEYEYAYLLFDTFLTSFRGCLINRVNRVIRVIKAIKVIREKIIFLKTRPQMWVTCQFSARYLKN